LEGIEKELDSAEASVEAQHGKNLPRCIQAGCLGRVKNEKGRLLLAVFWIGGTGGKGGTWGAEKKNKIAGTGQGRLVRISNIRAPVEEH
jgi:hypothetical protein